MFQKSAWNGIYPISTFMMPVYQNKGICELFAYGKKEGNDKSNPPFESKHNQSTLFYFAAYKAAT